MESCLRVYRPRDNSNDNEVGDALDRTVCPSWAGRQTRSCAISPLLSKTQCISMLTNHWRDTNRHSDSDGAKVCAGTCDRQAADSDGIGTPRRVRDHCTQSQLMARHIFWQRGALVPQRDLPVVASVNSDSPTMGAATSPTIAAASPTVLTSPLCCALTGAASTRRLRLRGSEGRTA